jgi:hypothetical protein
MPHIDQSLTYAAIEQRLANTTNPRHRMMLERLLQHSRGECEADLEAVMATLAPNPVYRTWQAGPEMNVDGTEAVRAFYINEVFGKGRHVFEAPKYRIVVDDDTIITEGISRTVIWGRDLIAAGASVDDADACYVYNIRILVVWPYDENGYLLGEEGWSAPVPGPLEKLADEDVPAIFKTYVQERLAA